MRFLLDTNICVYIIKRKPYQVFEKFQMLERSEVGVSAITVAELEYGVSKSHRPTQNQDALNQFLQPLQIIPFDLGVTQVYGSIRANLERQGIVVGAMDLLIASQAVALGLILVTNNVREFSRISNLVLENWVE